MKKYDNTKTVIAVSNIPASNNGKTIRSKILRAQNIHELSNTISLAKKEVNESNVIKVTRSEIKPCNNSEIILYVARLDYLVEKQDDKE
ncbi:MAG TPA: hypothetical protein VFI70_05800 [Nitrososphaeraceae archaeon]|nr:hypothetical protein [Nitrososphaeraceae archaeon]